MNERRTLSPVEHQVWEALARVLDPELDEPITSLGFVDDFGVEAGVARVRLRLPTFYCAPNFVWMMVADVYDAVRDVDGVERVEVGVDDHFASDEINAAMATDAAIPQLEELRLAFRRKAYMAAIDRVCRRLRRDGTSLPDLAGVTLADVPASADLERLRRCRTALRLPVGALSPLLLDESGESIPLPDLAVWLRRAQTVRVNIEGNTELCGALLRSRNRLGEL